MPKRKQLNKTTLETEKSATNGQEQLVQKKPKCAGTEKGRGGSTAGSSLSRGSLLAGLDSAFLVRHPPELLEFWDQALHLNAEAPRIPFASLDELELVGPFMLISDISLGKEIGSRNSLVESRFSTDLPEMQTILVYNEGRFCYWRDSPSDLPNYIIHVRKEDEHFPTFDIIGERSPFSAIQYLLLKSNKSVTDFAHLFPQTYELSGYTPKYLEVLKKQRAKESLGRPFHGMGIKVQVNSKGVGYRPLSDDVNENNRLKKDIEAMGTTDNEDVKKLLREKLYKIYSWVQFANDEMDFGMGLEFGHDLFVSNYACFDGMAKSVLKTAYELLERKEFSEILEQQWTVGRR